ncbi:hypothetical protein YH63_013885 [Afipia massiliensis]|uniref:Uncharacterized protein n=1 Tax=Afipia massiliensis TaxID=211460 RepID=A0A4U6BR69_9BRAD|nr:hypothetical protein [Afipia massiliensis]TKT72431.1 hypothetical protein YH63_013885 [Afipia massiliensis]
MANEAFALSPISARATSPTDADFEAIREAFLETARGRWFLDEYTKRNRNADTAMVLEAVARIERTLAAQKEEQQPQEEPVAQPSNELPEAMAAVRAIVAATRESVSAALDGQALTDALAPSRKCARVIREIAWGLRESGADGRICSLLESQVDAINAACDHAAAAGLRDDVLRAFDQAARDIEAIAPSAVEPHAEAEPVATVHVVDFSPAPVETPGELQIAALDDELFDVTVAASEEPSPEAATETVMLVEDTQPVEMAATVEMDEAPEPVKAVHLAIVPEAAPEPVLEVEPAGLVIGPEIEAKVPAPASLGASLIASGIVAKPVSPRSDPLAPIRRMSQAEKVAFFS